MQNFYDKDKYVVREEYDEITKIQTIHVTPLFVPQVCPHCDHTELIKKSIEKRTIMDVECWEPAKIILYQRRYQCKYCGTTFIPEGPFKRNQQSTKDFADFVAWTMINEEKSLSEMSTRCDVSKGFLSKTLNDYIKEFNESKFQIHACTKIYFRQLHYNKTIGCCVCGSDSEDDKDLKLLGIYETYSADAVKQFFYKVSSLDAIKIVFCDFEPEMILALQDYFKRSIIAINRNDLLDEFRKIVVSSRKDINESCMDFYKTIKPIIENPIINIMKKIEHELSLYPPKIQNKFLDLVGLMKQHTIPLENMRLCKDCEFDISPVTDKIKKMREHNVPFALMTIRMMILNGGVRKQLKNSDIGKYMRNEPERLFNVIEAKGFTYKDIYTYYVDMKNFFDEY